MHDLVFVRTRYKYDSYIDFWTLVELSGFDTCYVDEVDVRRHKTYIVSPFNGEWQPHIDNQVARSRNAKLIHWCLERPSGAGGIGKYAAGNRMHMYKRLFDEVWVSDKRLAAESMFKFVVLGSDYKLGTPGARAGRKYAFAHISYPTHRRGHIYAQFDNGAIAPNCWPPERDEVLQQSKFGLCLHQDNYPYQEPLRLALFAAYGLPILMEQSYDMYPWSTKTCVTNPYDGMAGRLNQMLDNDYARWHEFGMYARDVMCTTYRFRDMVLNALDGVDNA